MISFQDSSRFYSRTSAGKCLLDVGEIRAAFALSESLPEKVRNFRVGRLAKIVSGDTPLPLVQAPKTVLHLLPIAALDATRQFDVRRVEKEGPGLKLLAFQYPGQGRYNLDGYICHNSDEKTGQCRSYVQVFRSGAIESIETQIMTRSREPKRLPAYAMKRDVEAAIATYLRFYKRIEIAPPVFFMLTILGVKGYSIPDYLGLVFDFGAVDRDDLPLPELFIEDFDSFDLKPVFDTLWQAAGEPEVPTDEQQPHD
jgi:hypothetical protein